jgi:hypothetical protein
MNHLRIATTRATEMNNIGVLTMGLTGSFSNAIGFFNEAMTLLSSRTSVRTRTTPCSSFNPQSADGNPFQVPRRGCGFLLPFEIKLEGDQKDDGPPADMQAIALYNEPIMIASSPNNGSEASPLFSTDSALEFSICSIVIVFNLALLCHINGIHTSRHFHLSKAKALYEKCLQVLVLVRREHKVLSGSASATCDLIMMASLNNMIFMSPESHVERFLYIAHLSRRVALLNTSSYVDETIYAIMERKKQFFLLNIMALIRSQEIAPAA